MPPSGCGPRSDLLRLGRPTRPGVGRRERRQRLGVRRDLLLVGGAQFIFKFVEKTEESPPVDFVAYRRRDERADVLGGESVQILDEMGGDTDRQLGDANILPG